MTAAAVMFDEDNITLPGTTYFDDTTPVEVAED